MPKFLTLLNGLRTFEAAARRLSFTRAAEELNVTQSAVSYQIRLLEERLGVRLFRRRTRQVLLTEAGQYLLPHLQQAFTEIEESLAHVANQDRGKLTVAVSTYFAVHWLSARLTNFSQRHPDIVLRLHHSIMSLNLFMDDIDIAILWGKGNWKGLVVERLFPVALTPICAPSLAGHARSLNTPTDLRYQTLLRDDETSEAWTEWFAKAGIDIDESPLGPVIPDPNVRMQAAMDGQGLALADFLLAPELAAGHLIAPFDILLHGYGYYVVSTEQALRRAETQAFRNWLTDQSGSGSNHLDFLDYTGTLLPQC